MSHCILVFTVLQENKCLITIANMMNYIAYKFYNFHSQLIIIDFICLSSICNHLYKVLEKCFDELSKYRDKNKDKNIDLIIDTRIGLKE